MKLCDTEIVYRAILYFIDNGHGQLTTGKRSPDGQLREAFYNREIARRIVLDLQDRGYDAEFLVPEDDDISLRERCWRVNSWGCADIPFQGNFSPSISSSISAKRGTRWK